MRRLSLLLFPLLFTSLAEADGVQSNSTSKSTRIFEIYLVPSKLTDPNWYLVDVYLKNNSKERISGSINGCPLTYTVTYRNKTVNTYETGGICNTALYIFNIEGRSSLIARRGIQVARRSNIPLASYLVTGNYSFKPSGKSYITVHFSAYTGK